MDDVPVRGSEAEIEEQSNKQNLRNENLNVHKNKKIKFLYLSDEPKFANTVYKQHSLANVNAEVSSDGSGLGVGRVGLTQHHPACLYHTLAFPHLEQTRGMMRRRPLLLALPP